MARGWESKSVQEQQEDQQSRAAAPDPPAPQMSPEEREAERRHRRELESLHLARARIMQQLAAATDERYKQQLQAALQDLERKIAEDAG